MKRSLWCGIASGAVALCLLTACDGSSGSARNVVRTNSELLLPQAHIPDAADTHAQQIKDSFGSQSVVVWNDSTDTPRGLYLENAYIGTITKPAQADEAESIARRFVEKNAALFRIAPQDLKLTAQADDGKTFYLTFQQLYREIEVQNAFLYLKVTHDGRIPSYKNYLHPEISLSSLTAVVPFETAKQQAVASVNIKGQYLLANPSPVTKILPLRNPGEKNFHYYLAYEVGIFSDDPVGEFQIFVDAISGNILFTRTTSIAQETPTPATALVTGKFIPDKFGDSLLPAPFPLVEVRFDGTSKAAYSDFDGKVALPQQSGLTSQIPFAAKLRNPYFAVMDSANIDNHLSDILKLGANAQIEWKDDNASVEEFNMHYWLTRIIGFNEKILAYHPKTVLTAIVNFGKSLDNAFYNPLTKTISMGNGGKILRNTAHFRDIIIHEFTHMITTEICGLNAGYEFSAMNEAFSDYFTAALTNDAGIAKGVFVDAPDRALRTVENTLSFPKDITGAYHDDGQIFSGALWDLRKTLGKDATDIVDRLVHRARFGNSFTIAEFILDMLYADDDNQNPFDGTPHLKQIVENFEKHGLTVTTVFQPR